MQNGKSEKTYEDNAFAQSLSQKLKLVQLCVDHGANVVSSDTSTLSPFATAVSIGDKSIADFLHSKGAPKKVPLNMGAQYYLLYLQDPP